MTRRREARSLAANAAQAAFIVLYPVFVVIAVPRLGARAGAALLLLLVLAVSRRLRALGSGMLGSVALLLLLTALFDDTRFMLAYPSAVNAVLLAHFAGSLRTKMPMVERFARMQVSDLRPDEIRYCRIVTRVWAAFFAANGTIAAVLALGAPRAWWAAYAGVISYLLIGVLFSAEYVVRRIRFGRFGRNPVDRLLARALGYNALP